MIARWGILLFACTNFMAYTSDESKKWQDWKNWRIIRGAVCNKMGPEFKEAFDMNFKLPCEEGIKELADQFDTCDTKGNVYQYNRWSTEQSKLIVYINSEEYHIPKGDVTDIILAHKLKSKADLERELLG